jgi:hypothetical protein
MTKEQAITLVDGVSIEEKVDRCGELSRQKAAIEAEMKGLRQQIVQAAQFVEGSKTTRIIGRLFVAKIEKKEETKYDKASLQLAMEKIGTEKFQNYFDWEFVAKARKPVLDAFISENPLGYLIGEARSIREMSPSVTFTDNEEV